jgi:hypothetical protein
MSSPRTFRSPGLQRLAATDGDVPRVGEHIDVQVKRGRLECTVDARTLGVESLWPELTDT